MPHPQAPIGVMAEAIETRHFAKLEDRQVQKYDDSGNAVKVSDIELHKEFMRAADQAFMPAPVRAQTLEVV